VIIQLAIAGSALYAGIEAYRYHKKPTFAQLLAEQPKNSQLKRRRPYASRREMLAQLTKHTNSNSRRVVNTHFALALGSLALTSVGSLSLPLFTVISTPVLTYLVLLFIRDGALLVVRQRRVGMAVIDAIVTTSLMALGYFWAVALYTSFFYFSRKLVLKAQDTYQQHLGEAIGDIPRFAWVWHAGSEVYTPLDQINMHDEIVVHAGEYVPVDGRIVYGFLSVDQRVLTGEAQPVEKKPGDRVFATTLVLVGTSRVRVEHHGTETIAAQIGEVLHKTSSYTSTLMLRGEVLGDRSAIPMLILSAATFLLLGPMSALTVLCSYIGYAMRILGPLSVLNFLERSSQYNILIKDGRVLEVLRSVDTIIFDKTGTLTREQPRVGNIYPFASYSEQDILRYAATAEQKQAHPSARAITQAAHICGLSLLPIDEASYQVSYGVKVRTGERMVRVGSERFMQHEGIALPESVETIQFYCARRGYSIVYVALDEYIVGAIEIRASMRSEAALTLQELQQRGLTVFIVSGDYEQPTRQIAEELRIPNYYAEMLPEDKAALVEKLQQEGKTVCFVGDGINDAIALKKASVSVSLRGASSIATDAAQIVLLEANLEQLLNLFELADQLESTMSINMLMSVVPGIITTGGVYLLHFGLVHAYVLYYAGFTAGITNAMLPLKTQE
jgi:Cu2+-exporting ATPase